MSLFSQYESVVYMRQMLGGNFKELSAQVLKVTPHGRYFIRIKDTGEKVTVAAHSLRHPSK